MPWQQNDLNADQPILPATIIRMPQRPMTESAERKNDPGPIARPFHELHSNELHEIIRRPPTWPVRWGVTLFFVLMLLLLAGSWLISYPDTVSAPITLASGKVPTRVSLPSEEKLAHILVQDGDLVVEGQILAYTEDKASGHAMPKGKIAGPAKRNTLAAPVSGRVLLAAPWQQLRESPPGQMLLSILPTTDGVQGVIHLSQSSLGKIAIGQKVLIKLEAFPYREFGLVEGTLSHVSMSPGQDNLYWGYVDLPQKLKTIQGQELPYRIGMRGQAKIITRERRLAERLFLKN